MSGSSGNVSRSYRNWLIRRTLRNFQREIYGNADDANVGQEENDEGKLNVNYK